MHIIVLKTQIFNRMYTYCCKLLSYVYIYSKLEALRERRTPLTRHLITPTLTTVCRDVVKVPSGNNVTMHALHVIRDLHVALFASIYWHVPMAYCKSLVFSVHYI